jgi:hypothetical protein
LCYTFLHFRFELNRTPTSFDAVCYPYSLLSSPAFISSLSGTSKHHMASEPKLAEATESANKNASAEQDVQNILAELKADAAPAAEKPDAPEEKKEDTHANGNKDTSDKADADAEAKEEERIVAAAAKLGQEDRSKDSGSRTGGHRPSRGGNRGGKRTNYRDNVKTDFSSLKETSDPVEIRKQVSLPNRVCPCSAEAVRGLLMKQQLVRPGRILFLRLKSSDGQVPAL